MLRIYFSLCLGLENESGLPGLLLHANRLFFSRLGDFFSVEIPSYEFNFDGELFWSMSLITVKASLPKLSSSGVRFIVPASNVGNWFKWSSLSSTPDVVYLSTSILVTSWWVGTVSIYLYCLPMLWLENSRLNIFTPLILIDLSRWCLEPDFLLCLRTWEPWWVFMLAC